MKSTTTKPSVRILLGVAGIAILLVLGGAGGAAADRLVTGKQIKDGTVTSADVKNKTITTTDIAAKTLAALAGKPGVAGAQGAAGQPGPAGPTGSPGPAGAAGVNGMTGVTMRSQNMTVTNDDKTIDVFCAPDERAVSAAHQTFSNSGGEPVVTNSYPIRPNGDAATAASGPIPVGSGWRATVANSASGTSVLATIAVVCAKD